MGTIVSPMPEDKRTPKLSNTRTDRDWIMIVLGVCLVIFFLVGGYLSCGKTEKGAPKVAGSCKRSRSPGSQ
jgi:hypothetical protein